MDKTLSQQICEICGIEERKKLVIGFDKLDITLPIFKTVKQTSNEPYVRVVKEHCLPDFENNNNNFMKLLEIVSKKQVYHFVTMVLIMAVRFIIFLKIYLKQLKELCNIVS